MEINDGEVVLLADLLKWYDDHTLRQPKTAEQMWVTIHTKKPAKAVKRIGEQK